MASVQMKTMKMVAGARASATHHGNILKISPSLITPRPRRAGLSAPKVQRLNVARADSLDSAQTQPEQPVAQETTGPLQWAHMALKFVQDAWNLLQRLVELILRIRSAASSIQASAQSISGTQSVAASSPLSAASSSPQSPAPLQFLSVATSGAVTHLRQTLTDATGTLEVKLKALEATTGERIGGLFAATRDSAQKLNALQASSGDQAPRLWSQSTTEVVEEEEALRRQVFAQVYAELNAQAKRNGGGNMGYSPA